MDDTLYEKAVALRHALHAAPELSGREAGTKRMLQQFLKANTPLSITDCGAWFYAVYRCGRPGARRIAFRADIDALPIQEKNSLPYASRCPGVAHKCGHDGHAAALAALACRVCAEGAPCDIYFIFQHAEETGEGGAVCAALLEQAEQLNRAVERARRGDATVRAPWAEEGRTALSGRTGQRSGGWLERGEDSAAAVDRAFQRDSRRYDQGFALY